MSEVTILSAQFGALSKTVDHVNHSIIVLKTQAASKEHDEKSKGVLELEPGELEQATDYMNTFLKRVALLEHPDEHSVQLLPNEAALQLTKTVIADTQDFFDQLGTIQAAIEKQQTLTSTQLELLDQIVEALDQERSELFKKLRAARG
jgi:small-conductance mechanosensitive channel